MPGGKKDEGSRVMGEKAGVLDEESLKEIADSRLIEI
jgi:hypothetical protein